MPTYTPQDIRSIRKRLRLTQQEFGQLLGCSAKTVSSWESGYRNPSGTARTAITQLARRRQAPKRRHRPGTTYTSIHQWANGRLVARYSTSTEAAQAIAPTRPGTKHHHHQTRHPHHTQRPTTHRLQIPMDHQQPTTTTSRKQPMKPTYIDIHQWTNIRERP